MSENVKKVAATASGLILGGLLIWGVWTLSRAWGASGIITLIVAGAVILANLYILSSVLAGGLVKGRQG